MQYHVPLWGIQWGCIFAFSQGIPIIYSVCRMIICQFRLSSLGRKVKFSCCRPGLFSLSLLHPFQHCNAQAFLPLGLGFLGTEKHPCTITPGICICIFSLLDYYLIFACVGHLPHSRKCQLCTYSWQQLGGAVGASSAYLKVNLTAPLHAS